METLLLRSSMVVELLLLTLLVAKAGSDCSQFGGCSIVCRLSADLKILRAHFEKLQISGMLRMTFEVEQRVDASKSMRVTGEKGYMV